MRREMRPPRIAAGTSGSRPNGSAPTRWAACSGRTRPGRSTAPTLASMPRPGTACAAASGAHLGPGDKHHDGAQLEHRRSRRAVGARARSTATGPSSAHAARTWRPRHPAAAASVDSKYRHRRPSAAAGPRAAAGSRYPPPTRTPDHRAPRARRSTPSSTSMPPPTGSRSIRTPRRRRREASAAAKVDAPTPPLPPITPITARSRQAGWHGIRASAEPGRAICGQRDAWTRRATARFARPGAASVSSAT